MDKLTEEQKQMIEEFRKLPGYDVNALLRTNVEEFLIKWSDTLLQKEREAGKREGIEMINEKISILQKDKALYKNRKDNDFYVVRIGELASLRDELKSQLVEKGKK